MMSGKHEYQHTCSCLIKSAKDFSMEDKRQILKVTYSVYLKSEDYVRALRIGLFLDNQIYVQQVFQKCDDHLQKKQLCYILARHRSFFKLDDTMVSLEEINEFQDIINNSKLSQDFVAFAQDLNIMKPISPKEVYRGSKLTGPRKSLGDTFVSAFVNAGFGKDKLIMEQENWVHERKGKENMSATASVGMIMLWNDAGRVKLAKYLQHSDKYILAGALIGEGIISMFSKRNVDDDFKYMRYFTRKKANQSIRIGSLMALGIGHANTRSERITDALVRIIMDDNEPLEVVAFAAISLALMHIGSVNDKAAKAIKSAIMMNSFSSKLHLMRLLCLSLGLLYMGKDKTSETVDLNQMQNMKKICEVSLLSWAYAGTGDIDKLKWLEENRDEAAAVLGIAMVAMAGESDIKKAIDALESSLEDTEKKIVRKAVPLALSLLSISNPNRANVVDTLMKLTHDSDPEVAMCALISLGLGGSGTKDVRIVLMLRELSSYYSKDADKLFCVQIALGLVHLGKGLITLDPNHSDHFLLSPVAIGGLMIFLHCCLDIRELILDDYHYVVHFLVLAMQPRILLTMDENLNKVSVPVRVGKAVDGVMQSGQGRTITDSKTLKTPVPLFADGRAELCNQKYVPLSPMLEGYVILKSNLDYKEDTQE